MWMNISDLLLKNALLNALICCKKWISICILKEKPKYINSDDQIEIKKGYAQAVFNITKSNNGTRYFLSIRHENKELSLLEKPYFVLTEDPSRIIVDNKLYTFKDINSKKLMPFFQKDCIHIPKTSERKWFKTFALESIKQYKIKPEGFEINKIISDKQAEISFENDLNGDPTLILWFWYNKQIRFLANKGSKSSVRFEEKDGEYIFYKIDRDFEWENKIIEYLQSINLTIYQDSHFAPNKVLNADKSEKTFEFISWLTTNKKKLKSTDIELIQRYKEIQYSLFEPEIQSNIKEENDWFDLYIQVQIGEFEIPFTKFRKNILNGIREFKLPNGEIAILPKEWFEQYIELFQFGRDANKHIQLDKHHFGLLETSAPVKSKSIIQKYRDLISGYDKMEHSLPNGLKANLRPYQNEGYQWMQLLQENHFGGCLADDMGLGKTVQTLTLLLNSKGKINNEHYEPEQKKFLISTQHF